jgi:hypothetical protein
MQFSKRFSKRRNDRGMIVEGAIVLTVFLMLVFAFYDFGRLFMCRLSINEAVALAVEYGTKIDNISAGNSLQRYPSGDQVGAHARAALGPQVDRALVKAIDVNTAVSIAGRPAIKVEVRYEHPLIGPFMGFLYPNGIVPVSVEALRMYPD